MSRQLLFIIFSVVSSMVGAAEAPGIGPPGAFPSVRFTYADGYRGWPIAPVHRQHPIRGSFLEPRYPGRDYHWGVDISVRDDRRERGAPRGRTHRVYAVETGVVRGLTDATGVPCMRRFVELGHFSYWHVDATVRRGQYVRAGQPIGWTCEGAWHVHLGEWAIVGGRRVWVNPLHRGGKLAPYADTAAPEIREIAFHTPSMAPDAGERLDPSRLRGIVDVRALIGDPQSFRGWMRGDLAALVGEHHPYELSVSLRHIGSGKRSSWTVFRSDVWFGADNPAAGTPIPFRHHYAPRTTTNVKVPSCLKRLQHVANTDSVDCKGRQRFRLFGRFASPFWNTRDYRNGRYRIDVTARDVRGNTGTAVALATVAN